MKRKAKQKIAAARSRRPRSVSHCLIAFMAAIAVVMLASVALAHNHRGATAVDKSHCGICLSAHSGAAGVTASPAGVDLVLLVSRLSFGNRPQAFVSIQSGPAQGRAPPGF